MKLTIGYITARTEPMIHWFFDSLNKLLTNSIEVNLVVVDLHAHTRDRVIPQSLRERLSSFHWIEPKPSVWHGRHRLTKCDFFSASNFRNTVIALAHPGHIALVDDLSVLSPTWFESVLNTIKRNHITCGSFQKVRNLVVDNGSIIRYNEYKEGFDSRWGGGDDLIDVACAPEWMFGCSLCAPVEAFLSVNGYPEELCDGMGYEDCITGVAIALKGFGFRYSRRMKTFESEEHHHNQTATVRYDPGDSPNDKSHKLLEKTKGCSWFNQDFGGGHKTLRDLRDHMLSGGKFPIRKTPTHEWFTGIALDEFHDYPKRNAVNTKTES